ncbi:SDR family NAD(P)-dependent oxidoreductase [Arenicella xantha]|uniref:Short-subunit dehydrogenase n=1 Tax=Arenicella xantha TaxID=644221 RepID=A0A395JI78_9GAMM|nr:SDR family NAD(P)-dependent oxidoreductase [Arenicella xantha]RBP48296.1 short-subunit dehydrogenase [Arenicella xantha]
MHKAQQKTILITGCSSGIGRETARILRDHDFHVVASARKASDVIELERRGFETLLLDLDDSLSIQSAVEYIQTNHPNLFGLINNAAFGQPGAVEDLDRATLRAQFETNVFGTHELTRHLIPLLRQQTDARIIQISSVLGFVALPLRGAYVASKYALEGLSDTLRLELSNTNIKISLIEPGAIDTQFRANALIKLQQNIEIEQSRHKPNYTLALQRLSRAEPARFSASSERVSKDILHALTAKRPKLRYRITLPTIIIAQLKRILSTRMLDKIIGNNG